MQAPRDPRSTPLENAARSRAAHGAPSVSDSGASPILANEEQPAAAVAPKVQAFADGVAADLAHWCRRVAPLHQSRQKTVLWGGGSEAAAFLTALGVTDQIVFAVDLDPRREATIIAGTGHPIFTSLTIKAVRCRGRDVSNLPARNHRQARCPHPPDAPAHRRGPRPPHGRLRPTAHRRSRIALTPL